MRWWLAGTKFCRAFEVTAQLACIIGEGCTCVALRHRQDAKHAQLVRVQGEWPDYDMERAPGVY